ncbi:MAG: hypothetical protein ABI550_00895, partial [Ignavibacteriaceae bacterium]
MKKYNSRLKLIFLFLIIVPSLHIPIFAENFKIVFVACPAVAKNAYWLDQIKGAGATGVCLRVIWGDIDTRNSYSQTVNYYWSDLDAAINAVRNKGLDIYIRISMGIKKPKWVKPTNSIFTYDDFQTKEDGLRYDYYSANPGNYISCGGCSTSDDIYCRLYMLNFTSTTAKSKMKDFFTAILNHISGISPRVTIKEVVPTLGPTEETEYPNSPMCGYSPVEISAFRFYLRGIYNNNFSNLKNNWGSNPNYRLTEWDDITPKDYNWASNDNLTYKYGLYTNSELFG